MGLAVRAAGYNMKVMFCQCMKDGRSSEVHMLQSIGVTCCFCPERFGFFWNMTEEQKEEAKAAYTKLFLDAAARAVKEKYDLLIVDEFMSAYNHGLIDQKKALDFLFPPSGPSGDRINRTGSGRRTAGTGGLRDGDEEDQASL